MKYIVQLQLKVNRFRKDTEGASGIEYAIIAAMVAVAIATFSTTISTAVKGVFQSILTAL
jgi:pilus assembly protein Flp/PilA